jgi:hypothetical protein
MGQVAKNLLNECESNKKKAAGKRKQQQNKVSAPVKLPGRNLLAVDPFSFSNPVAPSIY